MAHPPTTMEAVMNEDEMRLRDDLARVQRTIVQILTDAGLNPDVTDGEIEFYDERSSHEVTLHLEWAV